MYWPSGNSNSIPTAKLSIRDSSRRTNLQLCSTQTRTTRSLPLKAPVADALGKAASVLWHQPHTCQHCRQTSHTVVYKAQAGTHLLDLVTKLHYRRGGFTLLCLCLTVQSLAASLGTTWLCAACTACAAHMQQGARALRCKGFTSVRKVS